jgi:hypothetical protein
VILALFAVIALALAIFASPWLGLVILAVGFVLYVTSSPRGTVRR